MLVVYIHQSLDDAESRDGETRAVAESTAVECWDPCSYESNSDYKLFGEHWTSGIGAAIADIDYRLKFLTRELRWSGINLPTG